MTSERKLLQLARQFDHQALAEIYDHYSPKLYRYAMRLLGDVDLAEDCVADTFSRFLRALKGGGGPKQHLQAYLYRVAHNWVVDHYRRTPPVVLDDQRKLSEDGDLAQKVETKLESERVRSALRLLTPEQRQVIVLKYLEELSNREVAEIVGKSVGAVKALQHRALASLERLLISVKEENHVSS